MLGQKSRSLVLWGIFLAWRDWKFERTLSLCAVLALASMLTPLLVLQGLKNGVISGMRERLLEDPTVLILSPKSDAGRFDQDFITGLARLPEAQFAIGRTRETATDLSLYNEQEGKNASLALEPAAEGEPVLASLKLQAPKDGAEPQIILSAPAAKALNVKPGTRLLARLGRRSPEGRLESAQIYFQLAAILPEAVADRRMGFVPLAVLDAIQDYRDYLAVPERGFAGNAREGKREYASFRLYAHNLDGVESLAAKLEAQGIETRTRAREIAAIRALEASINQVILIISLAVGLGFAAFSLSSAEGAVRRKLRLLGMLRLLGLSRKALTVYPMTQSLLTALCGFGISLALYAAVALGIARAFAGEGGLVCRLGPDDLFCAALLVLALSLLGCARAAHAASGVEPATIIREP